MTTSILVTNVTPTEIIDVWRDENFIIAHVGEPNIDYHFGQKFRKVSFVNAVTGRVMENSLYEGRYGDLSEIMNVGNIVRIKRGNYNWIKTINGKDWH